MEFMKEVTDDVLTRGVFTNRWDIEVWMMLYMNNKIINKIGTKNIGRYGNKSNLQNQITRNSYKDILISNLTTHEKKES